MAEYGYIAFDMSANSLLDLTSFRVKRHNFDFLILYQPVSENIMLTDSELSPIDYIDLLPAQKNQLTNYDPTTHKMTRRVKVHRFLMQNLITILKPGDSVTYYAVNQLGSTADDAAALYFSFITREVNLKFISDPALDSDRYEMLMNNFTPYETKTALIYDIVKQSYLRKAVVSRDYMKSLGAYFDYVSDKTNESSEKALIRYMISNYHENYGGYFTHKNLLRYMRQKFSVTFSDSTYYRVFNAMKEEKGKQK